MTTPPQDAEQLQAHLQALGIESTITAAGNVSVRDCKALFVHLTDGDFVERDAGDRQPRKGPPVPVHRVDNPIGALHEWCQQRGPDAKPPVWEQSENIGTVHAPRFRCVVRCAKEEAVAEASSKAAAKRLAAQDILKKLAEIHGAERP